MRRKASELSNVEEVDVSGLIDRGKLGRLQVLVAALCGIVVAADGFDAQAIGYVAPSLSAAWSLAPGALGPAFAAGMVGMMLGAFMGGPLADRYGRKPIIVACLAIVGICSLMTITAESTTELVAWRLLTGIGLGGSYPNAIALTCEYSPRRLRATMITAMFIGFSIGSATGGVVAAALTSAFGWQAVFWIGGAIPLALIPLVHFLMPESLAYLALRRPEAPEIAATLVRLDPELKLAPNPVITIPETKPGSLFVSRLYRDGRGIGTAMLWIMFAAGLFELYFLSQWLPTVTHQAGIALEQAVLITAGMQLAVIVSTVLFGVLMDRFSAFPLLPVVYLLGAVSVASIGLAGPSVAAAVITVFCAGFFVGGGQNAANALCAMYYPTFIRSTGVSWGHGVGRLGAILGALAGGVMLSRSWEISDIFLAGAVPMLCAALAATVMGLAQRGAPAEPNPNTVPVPVTTEEGVP